MLTAESLIPAAVRSLITRVISCSPLGADKTAAKDKKRDTSGKKLYAVVLTDTCLFPEGVCFS